MRVAGALLAVAVVSAALAVPASATFPGRNGRIVFTLDSFSGDEPGVDEECITPSCHESRLGAIDPRTGRRLRFDPCTSTIECNDLAPAFSADGRRLAFGRYEYSTPPASDPLAHPDRFQVATTGLAGRSVSILSEPAFDPAWSPNGRWIAVARRDGLTLVSSDRARTREVTDRGDESPDWSSTGRLAFVRWVGRRSNIYTVAPDGSDLERITAGGGARDPSWSPDGRSLVFTRVASDPRARVFSFVVVRRADGRTRVVLRGGGAPVWSPDGKLLAIRRRSGIWLLRLRDGALQHLMTNPDDASVSSLTWAARRPF